jgi:hypothetical protein
MTMMKYALPVLALASLAACPGPDDKNAETVWLAPDGRETAVRLVEGRPPPF